ncbi:PAS domain-containing protein [Ensifer adhaerens]|uniref:PAS domain-containing protein n=1 Tax=Ensifer adhaerens TaxID=106592 RepID=UPI003F84313B
MQSAAGIVQTDHTGRFLVVNNRFCEILGYCESELLSTQMRDIYVAGDVAEAERLFRTMAERVQSFEMESRLLRKNGMLASSVSALRDKDGGFQQATAIIVDMTERKRPQDVERRLAVIIASSNDAILGIDLYMKITRWNAERLCR